MKPGILLACALCLATPLSAADETLVAVRTIPARTIVAATDLSQVDGILPGTLSDPSQAIGLEARVTIYQGRPLREGDVGAPALVERNEIVALVYQHSGLEILTDGRVLGRAAMGERVRVMNLGSRITITGTVTGPGQVSVP